MHDERNLRAMSAAAPRPVSGKLSYGFSCFNQDQPIDEVDFAALVRACRRTRRRRS
jgi:hypothetical protein